MIDEDLDLEDLDVDEPDAFEDGSFAQVRYTEFDSHVLEQLTDAHARISSMTANEFMIEIYAAATMLRNVCGDADAFVAEQANTIRQNILVLANEIAKDPAALVIAAAQSIEDEKTRFEFLCEVNDKLYNHEVSLEKHLQNEVGIPHVLNQLQKA